MNTLLAALAVFSATTVQPVCNPSQGNWVNAATQSCAKSDASHTGDPAVIKRDKDEDPEETAK